VKVDAALRGPFEESGTIAAGLEEAGYDGIISFEGPHDPFVPLVLAATQTSRVELCTGIAVAFARNPMNLANLAYDLQLVSRGRFILGLGSQIKPHIEKRFSMPWSHPAARMRELILAIRAIWASWQEDKPLRFEGEFYRHTLMTPFFNPGPNRYGLPRIFLAGVGPAMTEVAGEVADGFMVHPFSSEKFLRETTWPALRRGLAVGGRDSEGFEVAWTVLVGADSVADRDRLRSRLAFYASTPAYRPVLETHGWGSLQPSLNQMSKQGEWGRMASLITDEMVDAYAVVAAVPSEVGKRVAARAGGLVTRVSLDGSGQEAGGEGAINTLHAAQ
jgi:probable F420-dependent oxidoreductase